MARLASLSLFLSLTSRAARAEPNTSCNPRDYGAIGDGIHDDTAAFNATITGCVENGTAVLFIPAGYYVLSETLVITSALPLTIKGEGFVSNLLWTNDTDLFLWNTSEPTVGVLVKDLAISSVGEKKSQISTALHFTAGAVKSVFSTLFFYGAGSPIGEWQLTLCGTDIDLGIVSDTVTVQDVVHWFVGGTGVKASGPRWRCGASDRVTLSDLLPRAQIGRGSEVRILGGRIIGPANKSDGSIGVHATGGNGGVHVAETDVIGLGTGVLLDASGGAGSNREVFITHATMDSDGIGLHVVDDSYVSVAGCWAASSDRHNVLIDVNATGAVVVIAGGTIFNGGAEVQGPCPPGECGGIMALAGTFQLTGVDVRYNRGVGIAVGSASVVGYAISGCRINNNGQGLSLDGAAYAVTGNVVVDNAAPSDVGPLSGGAVVNSNVGLNASAVAAMVV